MKTWTSSVLSWSMSCCRWPRVSLTYWPLCRVMSYCSSRVFLLSRVMSYCSRVMSYCSRVFLLSRVMSYYSRVFLLSRDMSYCPRVFLLSRDMSYRDITSPPSLHWSPVRTVRTDSD